MAGIETDSGFMGPTSGGFRAAADVWWHQLVSSMAPTGRELVLAYAGRRTALRLTSVSALANGVAPSRTKEG